MKKLLSILGVLAISTTGASQVMAMSQNIIATDFYKAELPIKFKKQEKDYWCGPAVVQSVLSSKLNKDVSQTQLAKELKTEENKSTYMEDILRVLKNYNLNDYELDILQKNFGKTNSDLLTFQDFISESIGRKTYPIILINSSFLPVKDVRHFMVVYSIDIKSDSKKTIYKFMEPDSGQSLELTGDLLGELWTGGQGSIIS